MTTINPSVLKRTEELQKEMHTVAEKILKETDKKDMTYQDAVNVFFLVKIAEIQEELRKMPTTA